jgi:allantoinase
VHLGDLGQAEREDFDTGTAGAALAGITCVLEHPLSEPPTTTAERYVAKRDAVAPRARIDFGLWGSLVPGALDEIQGQWEAGARGFKAFMCDSAGSYPACDDATLLAGMRRVAALGGLVLVHAENDTLVAAGAAAMKAAGRHDPLAHAEGRPEVVELEAAARAILLAREAGARLQIVHVSSADAALLVDAAVARGCAVTLEHTAQHLILDEEALIRRGPYARCAPPLRSRATVERLWARLLAGAPAQLGSDHAPYTIAEKERGRNDIYAAGMGIQSIQECVPLVLDEAIHRRGLPLARLAELVAGHAARTLGLWPRKGAITAGAEADLALWDPEGETVISAAAQRSRNPWTPYEGRRLGVRLVRLLQRGRTIVADGELLAAPGDGRFVVPGDGDWLGLRPADDAWSRAAS